MYGPHITFMTFKFIIYIYTFIIFYNHLYWFYEYNSILYVALRYVYAVQTCKSIYSNRKNWPNSLLAMHQKCLQGVQRLQGSVLADTQRILGRNKTPWSMVKKDCDFRSANPRDEGQSKKTTSLKKIDKAVFNIPLSFHSIGWLMRIPLLDYQIMIMPNILGSIIPQLIINQQGFWTLLNWPWRPHRWIKNIISCALTVLAVYFLFAFGSGGSEGPNGSALYLLRASFAAASSCWPTSALLQFRKILGLQTLENLKSLFCNFVVIFFSFRFVILDLHWHLFSFLCHFLSFWFGKCKQMLNKLFPIWEMQKKNKK